MTGYDIQGTPFWLCVRPECMVVFKMEHMHYRKLIPLIEYYEVRCCVCQRRLGDKEGL